MDKNNDVNIAICGIAGSGKDTLAGILLPLMQGVGLKYKPAAFAKPLKDFTKSIFKFNDYDVYDQLGKELVELRTYKRKSFERRFKTEVAFMVDKYFLAVNGRANWTNQYNIPKEEVIQNLWLTFLDLTADYIVPRRASAALVGWFAPERAEISFRTSPRVLLQILGTEFFRENVANDFWTTLAPKTNAIITDLRFANELDSVKANNGVTIGIIGRNVNTTQSSGHASEQVGDVIRRCDYIINNSGTLDDLKEQAIVFLSQNFYIGEVK